MQVVPDKHQCWALTCEEALSQQRRVAVHLGIDSSRRAEWGAAGGRRRPTTCSSGVTLAALADDVG